MVNRRTIPRGRFNAKFIRALSLLGLLSASDAWAGQVVVDNSFGHAGVLNSSSGNFMIPAALGKQSGPNLFQSFKTLNLNQGETATFIASASTKNILARVTGGAASNIDGTIATRLDSDPTPLGNAHPATFYFINPAGVIFGPDAQLSVGGSFAVTTADVIKLADGGHFDARTPANSVLSTAAPVAFGFLASKPAGVSFAGSGANANNGSGFSPGGPTVSIVAGQIQINNRLLQPELTQVGGTTRINIVAVSSPGTVGLDASDPNAVIDMSQAGAGGLISISGNSTLGSVSSTPLSLEVRGSDISLADTIIDGQGGTSHIVASGMFTLARSSIDVSAPAYGGGNAGSLYVTATTASLDGSGRSAAALKADGLQSGGSPGAVYLQTGALTAAGDVYLSAATRDSNGIPGGPVGSVQVQASSITSAGAPAQFYVSSLGVGVFSPASQVTLDNTLGSAQSLSGPSIAIPAALGQPIGQNLFFSFSSFSIAAGDNATFSAPASIHNIVARVTGGSPSNINGTLATRVDTDPNTPHPATLYLVNPAGIVFGANATLDVGGSFAATTAGAIRFSDGGRFDALAPAQSSLTGGDPSAFSFSSSTAVPAGISVAGSAGQQASLAMLPGGNFSLVGGPLLINHAVISAPAGRINLVGVASPGDVLLDPANSHTPVNLQTFSQFASITITDATVQAGSSDAIAGGGIFVGGGDVTLGSSDAAGTFVTSRGTLRTFSNGAQPAGDLVVNCAGTFTLIAGNVFSDVNGGGDGGAIRISAATLDIGSTSSDPSEQTSGIYTTNSNSSTGRSGDISLQATAVNVLASVQTTTANSSDGGSIKINVAGAFALGGNVGSGSVQTNSSSSGQGGELDVSAASISLVGYSTTLQTNAKGSGNGGALSVTTGGSLSMSQGAAISTSAVYQGGLSGNLTIQADRMSIDQSIISSAGGGNVNVTVTHDLELLNSTAGSNFSPANLAAPSISTGIAVAPPSAFGSFSLIGGEVVVHADTIHITDGMPIVNSLGGNVSVTAGTTLRVEGGGAIGTSGDAIVAGSVTVQAPSLYLDPSSPSLAAVGSVSQQGGKAGDVYVQSGGLQAFNPTQFQIYARALDLQSTGGRVFINGAQLIVNGSISVDNTLGTAQDLSGPTFTLTPSMGQTVGSNLFFSLGQFNLSNNESLTLSNLPSSISTVLVRVTGGTSSLLNGFIAVPGLFPSPGQVNLFLMNPAGITVGPAFSASTTGSVALTTADALRLGTAGLFSASSPSSSVLTPDLPSSYVFQRASPSPLSVAGGTQPMGSLQPMNIVLVAGPIQLVGAEITSTGNIGVVSVGSPGEVTLDATSMLPSFGQPAATSDPTTGFTRLGDIAISGGTTIEAGFNDANILMRGNSLTAQQFTMRGTLQARFDQDCSLNGSISSQNAFNSQTYGTDIFAQSINLGGSASISTDGQAHILLQAQTTLTLQPGSGISSDNSSDVGNSLPGDVILMGGSISLQGGLSAIGSGGRPAGNITIAAAQVLDFQGASIESFVQGAGGAANGGTISLTGPSIVLDGAANPGQSISATAGITNFGGLTSITGGDLRIADGFAVTSAAGRTQTSQPINLALTGKVIIDGGTTAQETGIIFSGVAPMSGVPVVALTAAELTVQNGGRISADTFGVNNAGAITLGVGNGTVMINGGMISASSYDGAVPGSIDVTAGSIILSNKSQILSNNYRGAAVGGMILLNSKQLTLDGQSSIDATGGGGIDRPVSVTVNLQTGSFTDAAQLFLVGPSNTRVELSGGQYSGTFTFADDPNAMHPIGFLSNFVATDLVGKWSLEAVDPKGSATIKSWSLNVGADSTFQTTNASATGSDVTSPLLVNAQSGLTGGQGGTISIANAQSVKLLNGSSIQTNTLGTGNAGNINIAGANILVSEKSLIASQSIPNDPLAGNAGDIILAASNDVTVQDGLVQAKSNGSSAVGGSINISGTHAVRLNRSNVSTISAATGGNISITSQRGKIVINRNRADAPVSSASNPSDNAVTADALDNGNISLIARSIVVNHATISATARQEPPAGEQNNGQISFSPRLATTEGDRPGRTELGPFASPAALLRPGFVVLNDSRIDGRVGNGTMGLKDVPVSIDKSFQFIESGDSVIQSNQTTVPVENDIAASLVEFPSINLASAAQLLPHCVDRFAVQDISSFTIAGSGGTPPEPGGWLPEIDLWIPHLDPRGP